MTSEELLPLFPLEVVLFPGSALALHIFEERYKSLINKCIREKSEFGINCLTGGTLAPIGCSASVDDLVRRYSDGKMDIVVHGQRRYQLNRSDSTRAQYTVGFVQFFESSGEAFDIALARETVRLYNGLVDVVYKSAAYRVSDAEIAGSISFVLAQKSGLQLSDRQRLLELPSENERLMMLRSHLQEILPKLKEADHIEHVIRGDGYL